MKTKEEKNFGISCGYIDFVVGKRVEERETEDVIYIYSRKFGEKIMKRKYRFIGWVVRQRGNKYSYVMAKDRSLSFQTMFTISRFMRDLEIGKIVFDYSKGELYLV